MFVSQFRAEQPAIDKSPWGKFWFQPLGRLTASGARVSASSALGLPIVWSCVTLLAKSLATMPFMAFEPVEATETSLARRKKRRDHWIFRLFMKRPNRFQNPFEFKMMLMGHLALRGNAYCQITDDGKGAITELLPLHPDRMQVELLDNGSYRYRYTDQNGKTIYYTRGEIWHLRWLSDDGIVGLSPIEVAREAIGEGLAIQSYSSRFFANDARPGAWIEYDGKFADKGARLAFKESWQENYGGRNIRKVAVLEKGMKLHEMQLNNSDAQFIEARKNKDGEIPRIWGIPAHKVGVLDKATNNNIEQQSIEFWTDCMMPIGKLWSDSIEFSLLGEGSGIDVEFDIKPMQRGDGVSRANRLRSLVLGGILVRNEAREEEGYDPIEGLDDPLVPVNMAVVDEDGEIEPVAGDAGSDGRTPGAPDDGSGDRLAAMLGASAGRLARRAAGALTKKSAAEVFDAEFAALVAEALCVSIDRAATWCAKLRAADSWGEQDIARSLMVCANGN